MLTQGEQKGLNLNGKNREKLNNVGKSGNKNKNNYKLNP